MSVPLGVCVVSCGLSAKTGFIIAVGTILDGVYPRGGLIGEHLERAYRGFTHGGYLKGEGDVVGVALAEFGDGPNVLMVGADVLSGYILAPLDGIDYRGDSECVSRAKTMATLKHNPLAIAFHPHCPNGGGTHRNHLSLHFGEVGGVEVVMRENDSHVGVFPSLANLVCHQPSFMSSIILNYL